MLIDEARLRDSPKREWYLREYFPRLLGEMKAELIASNVTNIYIFFPENAAKREEVHEFERQLKNLTDEFDEEKAWISVCGLWKC